MLTQISPNFPKFSCVCCDIKTNNKKDFKNHLLTAKHQKSAFVNTLLTEISPISPKIEFQCEKCNKFYKSRVGLWKHKKFCIEISQDDENMVYASQTNDEITNKITPEMVLNVLEQNKELACLIIEQNKTILELSKNSCNVINSNNINSNNKTFNLQFFLNETCKDAMNIMDFVDSLKLQLTDLENVGKVGYIEGITNIIVKNLQALDINKRPVHCIDKKRETIYVKDDNRWEKESEKKNKLRRAIKRVANKNQRLLSKYKEEHPGCNFSESKYADQYSKIVIEAMGGGGDNDLEKEDKIIQKIAKEVAIDKNINVVS